MSANDRSNRNALVRNTIVFQLKLMADGLRDLVLLPVSLIAALVGFLRGGDEPDREFQQVIKLGIESEKWINLFGHHERSEEAGQITSIDDIFARVEAALKQQYQADGTSKSTQAEIDEALHAAQENVRSGHEGNST